LKGRRHAGSFCRREHKKIAISDRGFPDIRFVPSLMWLPGSLAKINTDNQSSVPSVECECQRPRIVLKIRNAVMQRFIETARKTSFLSGEVAVLIAVASAVVWLIVRMKIVASFLPILAALPAMRALVTS
jgi:hypothetical protein